MIAGEVRFYSDSSAFRINIAAANVMTRNHRVRRLVMRSILRLGYVSGQFRMRRMEAIVAGTTARPATNALCLQALQVDVQAFVLPDDVFHREQRAAPGRLAAEDAGERRNRRMPSRFIAVVAGKHLLIEGRDVALAPAS